MTLELIANALDAFPRLSQLARADIFSAVDLAPVFRIDEGEGYSDDEVDGFYEAYQASGAPEAYAHARTVRLTDRLTLDDAMFYTDAPTQADILKALDRAARTVKERA